MRPRTKYRQPVAVFWRGRQFDSLTAAHAAHPEDPYEKIRYAAALQHLNKIPDAPATAWFEAEKKKWGEPT